MTGDACRRATYFYLLYIEISPKASNIYCEMPENKDVMKLPELRSRAASSDEDWKGDLMYENS